MTIFEQEQVVNRLSSEGNYATIECTETDLSNPEFRRKIRKILHNEIVLIEFTKANGETRVMSCTTSEKLGAKITVTVHLTEDGNGSGSTVTKTKKENQDVCPVWDTKIEAWRSFRWSSLKKVDYAVHDK
jgi:hypothetical protein